MTVPIPLIVFVCGIIVTLIGMLWKMRGGYLSSIASNVKDLVKDLKEFKEKHMDSHSIYLEKHKEEHDKLWKAIGKNTTDIASGKAVCDERHE